MEDPDKEYMNMMPAKDYIVVEEHSPAQLAASVSILLRKGWQPHCGMLVYAGDVGNGPFITYAQPMVLPHEPYVPKSAPTWGGRPVEDIAVMIVHDIGNYAEDGMTQAQAAHRVTTLLMSGSFPS